MIIVFMLVSMGTWAQKKIQTYAIEYGEWNKKINDWNWENRRFIKLDVVLYNNAVIINDEAGTIFITTEVIYDKEGEVRWNAFDQEKVDCVIIMYNYDMENYLVVVYKDVCYKYIY